MKRMVNQTGGGISNGKAPLYSRKIAPYVEDAINLAGECFFDRTCLSIRPFDKLNIIIYLTEHHLAELSYLVKHNLDESVSGLDKSELKEKFLCDYCKPYEINLDSCIMNDKNLGSYTESEINRFKVAESQPVECNDEFCTELDLTSCPEMCSKINYEKCCLDDCIKYEETKCLPGFLLNKFVGHLRDNKCLIIDNDKVKLNYEQYPRSKWVPYLETLRDKCSDKLNKLLNETPFKASSSCGV